MKTKPKNHKNALILSSLLLTVVLLTSCKTFNKQSPEVAPTNTTTKTTETISESDDTVAVPSAKPIIYSASDQAAYAGALELNDVEFCNKITNESYRVECKSAVTDRAALETALDESDSSNCAKISNEDEKKACEIKIEVELQKAANVKAEEDTKEAGRILAQQIVDSGEIARCQDLGIESQRFDCEVNILVNQAQKSGDKTLCTKGSTDEAQNLCIEIVNNASR